MQLAGRCVDLGHRNVTSVTFDFSIYGSIRHQGAVQAKRHESGSYRCQNEVQGGTEEFLYFWRVTGFW